MAIRIDHLALDGTNALEFMGQVELTAGLFDTPSNVGLHLHQLSHAADCANTLDFVRQDLEGFRQVHSVERDRVALVTGHNLAGATAGRRFDQRQSHAVLFDLHDGTADALLFKQASGGDLPRQYVVLVDNGEQRVNAERLVLENAYFGHGGLLEMRSPAYAGLGSWGLPLGAVRGG